MTPFLDILYKLSHITELKLYPDKHDACKLVVTDQISIQLESDQLQERMLIACLICELPPGKFREEVLKHGLAANLEPPPIFGRCAISKRKIC